MGKKDEKNNKIQLTFAMAYVILLLSLIKEVSLMSKKHKKKRRGYSAVDLLKAIGLALSGLAALLEVVKNLFK